VLSSVVITGLLAACIATIAPPAALIVDVTGNAYTPAMAMAADGTKHIAWQECPQSGGCRIEYYRTKLGAPLVTPQYIAPPGGADNSTPDIAVADDGMAYIVWTVVYSNTPQSNHDMYAVINAVDGSVASFDNLDNHTGGGCPHVSAGGPRVVAGGNNVFGIYNVERGLVCTGGAFYRQLSGGVHSGTVALGSGCGFIGPCTTVHSPKAVLDNNGVLHVAYNLVTCDVGSCTHDVYQADNTMGADMTPISLTTFLPPPLTAPDIAVADDNSIFITYSYSNTTTDSVIYATGTSAATPFVTATVPLTPGLTNPWRVEGNVHIAAVNNVPVVAFAAKNNSTGNTHEVWMYTKGHSSVTPITNGNGDQNEPALATMGTLPDEVAVIGWRTWHQVSFFSCLRDGYEYDQFNLTVQKVYNSSGGCLSTGQAMAANALWASAVWIDRKPQDTRLVPWLGFNANTTMLPLIRR